MDSMKKNKAGKRTQSGRLYLLGGDLRMHIWAGDNWTKVWMKYVGIFPSFQGSLHQRLASSACGLLVHWPGIEPASLYTSAITHKNHWTSRKFLAKFSIKGQIVCWHPTVLKIILFAKPSLGFPGGSDSKESPAKPSLLIYLPTNCLPQGPGSSYPQFICWMNEGKYCHCPHSEDKETGSERGSDSFKVSQSANGRTGIWTQVSVAPKASSNRIICSPKHKISWPHDGISL